MMRKSIGGATLLLSAVALTGCTAPSDPGPSGAPEELTPIIVGVAPSTLSAPLYLAEEQGFFEDHGLDVTLETITSGAEAVPRVLSGEMAFTMSGVAETLEARNNGVDLIMIADYAIGPTVEERDYFGIIAKDESIRTVGDLEGKNVAVNVLSGGTVATANAGIIAEGGDPALINYVEVPSPQQVDAVANGTVDAAVALEPFVTFGLDQGMHLVLRPQVSGVAGMPSVALISSTAYVEANPDVTAEFVAAVTEANRYANENLDAAREISAYTGLDADVLARINLPQWSDEPTDWSKIDDLVSLLLEQGILSKDPDLATAIAD
jgi:NitT/TauT family transport system substrate-binding protein